MGWFTRKRDPMTERACELNAKIAALEHQIYQLDNAASYSDPCQIQEALEGSNFLPHDPLLKTEEGLVESVLTEPERDCPGLYNDHGLRKFDLAGWWLRMKHSKPLPAPTQNEQLVTYLATGRTRGHTALRKETRIARNRFILLTLVLLAVLWSILSLLIPQL
ncbi:MAG: hypothetical protein QF685_07710 [Verrucomicrobiota bacterium]|nr:hypothetical protein [Verrucomicrobiota bacterium]